MKARLAREDGWAVVTATVLLSIMMMVGLSIAATVDTGTERSREQRERESALNLTEGVLWSQGFGLAQRWPSGSATNPKLAQDCRSTTTNPDPRCPTTATLTGTGGNFTSVDFKDGVEWVARVRDNYGALAQTYDPLYADTNLVDPATGTTCANPCSMDFNRDLQVWIQARATAQGKPRSVVALMKLEQLQEAMPQVAVASGAISVTNDGNHGSTLMVDGTGSDILVRCTPDAPNAPNAKCTDYNSGQVSPAPKSGAPSRLMTNEQILRFRETARINGTWHEGCPTELYKAEILFIESCDPMSSPNYQGYGPDKVACNPPNGLKNSCINTGEAPGVIIVRCGGFQAMGNWTYVGIVYFANGIDGSCPVRGNSQCNGRNLDNNDVFKSNGGFGVWGVIAAEGPACMKFGSNNFQFAYNSSAFNSLKSYGTVGLVQNTWRELPSNLGA